MTRKNKYWSTRITDWAAAIIVFVIAASSFIALLLLIRATSYVLWSEKAAGWAQAFGGMLAVGAAFWVATNERRAAERHRRDDEIRRLMVIQNIAAQFVVAIEMIEDERYQHVRIANKNTIELLMDTSRQLASLPVFEVPVAKLASRLTAIQRFTQETFVALHMDIDAVNNLQRATHPIGDGTDERLERLLNTAREVATICSEEIQARRN